jgi:hypothetical protein
MVTRLDICELRDVLEKARIALNTTILPERAVYAKDLITQAVTMADGLIARPTVADAMKSRKGRR